jgi:gamma-glutamylcyclotransferase (GGCT)/AIG2-like uncharacterized protein YtfP
VKSVETSIGLERVTIPLFVYGTLSDPEIRVVLLGSEVEHGAAELSGYKVMAKDGFFLLAPSPGHYVRGELLFLNADQLSIADLWEEVPLYTREVRSVSSCGRHRPAWVYFRESGGATTPIVNDVCEIPRHRALELAKSFRRELSIPPNVLGLA